ncbi:hypothetical protein PanWU01x14_117670 [Parasponia andersonii]|uniref:Uncharacterized protein n=1 Tax=Parasponia andersonii TaxID=3476 RepID=A0A2P5CWN0_PARAD|nr:hypothetical protein PanWU01x14_117670 [Parasponia andersonii]
MPHGLNGRVDGINLCVQHVVVMETGDRVGHSLVGLEQNVVERNVVRAVLVSEIRVGVDEEWAPNLGVEVEDLAEKLGQILFKSPRRRRVGVAENGQGVSGCDGDLLVEAQVAEGVVDGLHCREEKRHQLGVVRVEDLVSDRDGGDLGLGEVRGEVGLDPRLGFDWVGHVLEVLVAEADDEVDLGIREGAEDVRIGVVELDSADV